MYKAVSFIYIVCFCLYVLFTRVPDYFEGDFITGVVTTAVFNSNARQPAVSVLYKVGSTSYTHTNSTLFIKKYSAGDKVTVIYDPSNPSTASIYSFIGYWIDWGELFFTAVVFAVLFLASIFITGENIHSVTDAGIDEKKRKYDD